ncbi:MAG: hypothetical protein LBC53_09885 [Spirochaetaceae bacterium]|jgi:hypothetical protein|nr:hypothetical protein [Spirochaetaceae bacterium]
MRIYYGLTRFAVCGCFAFSSAVKTCVRVLRFITGVYLKRVVLAFVLSPFFLSCGFMINGRVNASGAADFNFSASVAPKTAAILGGEGVLDAESINKSLLAAGFNEADLKNEGLYGLKGSLSVLSLDGLLSAAKTGGGLKFISFENSGGGGKFTLRLSRENSRELLLNISVDVRDYISAIFAPLATGENLSQAEYLNLVSDVYGKTVAEEIRLSYIEIALDFPSKIKRASGFSFKDSCAQARLPLSSLLTLENELYYEVVW